MKRNFQYILIALVILIFSLPAFFFFMPSPDYSFTGVHTWVNALDSFFQLEATHQGSISSSWLAENVYSTETPAVQRLLLFYTSLGKLSHLLHIDWLVVYQASRVLLAGIFTLVLFWFIGLFVRQRLLKYFILALSIFSGSLGLAMWPEGNLFLSLYNPPHIAFALILILVILGNFYLWQKNKRGKFGVMAGSIFVLGWVHPYDALSVLFVLLVNGVYLWFQNKDKKLWVVLLVVCAFGAIPLAFHYIWSYRLFASSNFSLDDYPVMLHLLPLYLGLNFILILWAAVSWSISSIKKRTPERHALKFWQKYWFLLLWLISGLLLLLAPWYFSRKLFLGVPIAINILAGILLFRFFLGSWLFKNRRALFLALYLLIASISTLTLLEQDISGLAKKEFPYALPRDIIDSYKAITMPKVD
ncbi:MAG: hypothetical protein WC838_03940, partial [Candidatus Margulisiibacteriota bacterium]